LLTLLKEGINTKKEALIQAVLNNFNELMNEINRTDSQIKDLINIVDCEPNFLELKNKLNDQSNPVQLDALKNEINDLKEKIDNHILNLDKLNFKVQFNPNNCGPISLGSIENIGDDFTDLKLKLESCGEATFQLEIDDFTKFSNNKEIRRSVNPCIVGHLPWRILAHSRLNQNKEYYLGFFLQCNPESKSR
jgi:DNA repair exonuclease SbcCD ATPase subunit